MQVAPPVWLFDLDNTLHDARPHIFPHINRAMVEYIRDHLGVDEDDATRIRQDYWQRYGATLLGLMRHHGTDPHHFLAHTHQFPDLKQMLVFERGLKAMLLRLPGRKLVFSNAPLCYSQAILELGGISACFDAVYSVERIGFQPKPAIAGFRHLLGRERLHASRCIMVEDMLPNLRTAKRLGMQTVWVSRATRHASCVDVRVVSILDLPRQLERLRIPDLRYRHGAMVDTIDRTPSAAGEPRPDGRANPEGSRKPLPILRCLRPAAQRNCPPARRTAPDPCGPSSIDGQAPPPTTLAWWPSPGRNRQITKPGE